MHVRNELKIIWQTDTEIDQDKNYLTEVMYNYNK